MIPRLVAGRMAVRWIGWVNRGPQRRQAWLNLSAVPAMRDCGGLASWCA